MDGSADAFEARLVELSPALGRLAAALTDDLDEAQDLLQTAAFKLWRSRRAFLAADGTEAYAVRTLVNTHLSRRSRLWHRERPAAELPEPDAVTPRYPVEEVAEVDVLLAGLPPQQRATLVLRVVCDLDDQAVAAALGCSPATVRSNASRALATLRATHERTTP